MSESVSRSVVLHVAGCVFSQSIIVMDGECKCEWCIACS